MSAYDTLLQELNIVYDLGLKPEDVKWGATKCKLPETLASYMKAEYEKEWFKKVRLYRNTAAHRSLVPTASAKVGIAGKPWAYILYNLHIQYIDKSGHANLEEIKVCTSYLSNMVEHINQVWQEMAKEFR